jgi:CTP synthase (UTP-ammonia lyase)
MRLLVGLIGDRNDEHVAHRAIPRALTMAGEAAGLEVVPEWIGTETIDVARPALFGLHALWCVPASPYRHTAGAIAAVRFARENDVPFLGTCGGFQHALLECAERLWGVEGAVHAELDPDAVEPVIAPLSCALVEKSGRVRFAPGSRLAAAYGDLSAEEEYHCSYGLGAAYRPRLESGPLRATAWDDGGDVRGIELEGHRFFVATLFQPERSALRGAIPAIVAALLAAAAAGAEAIAGS